MKKLIETCTSRTLFATLFLVILRFVAFAQDKVVTTTRKETHTWYVEPWVWVIGGIALVILLAAIFRGRSKTIVTNNTTRTTE